MGKPGVYITREQDVSIRFLANSGWSSKAIIKYYFGLIDQEYSNTTAKSLYIIQDMNFDSLAIALYDSYEVEKTPDEKLVEYYNKNELGTKVNDGVIEGIRKTLEILDLKVKGINK